MYIEYSKTIEKMRLFRCVSEKKIIFLLNCVSVKLITESARIIIKAFAYSNTIVSFHGNARNHDIFN